MAKIDILSKIRLNRNNFTKVEQLVADFVLENPKKVLYTSITDLAAMCNVGDTSVFRFCRTLGFQGYQEFKMNLAQSIDIRDDCGDENVAAKENPALEILNKDIAVLNETYSLVNYDNIKKAVGLMMKAKRICFFGVGASLITAIEAKSKFMRILPNVDCIFDSHLQAMQAALMTPKDVAFIISYSGSTKDAIEVAKICKSNSTKIICLTRFLKSPLESFANLTLLCGSNEGPLQGGSLSAKISQLYVIDVLYDEFVRQTAEVSKSNREKTSSAILDKMY